MPDSDRPIFRLGSPIATHLLVTSPFNAPRSYPHDPQKRQLHEGIDLRALDANGRPVEVLAAQDGEVTKVGDFPPGYGRYIRIRHQWLDGSTYVTWYAHLAEILVGEGQTVSLGKAIGVAGDTGNASGIHLHLTLQHITHGLQDYVVNDVVDPLPFLHSGPRATGNECAFVADETIPDGTMLLSGQRFEKVWRVRNSGSSAWEADYELAHFGEERMGGPNSVPLPDAKPGDEVLLSLRLQAPSVPGRFRSLWKPRDPSGDFFEFIVFADIEVPEPPQDGAKFLEDVTVPDGTIFKPGESFQKVWRVRNVSSKAWEEEYRLAFFDHEQMDGPDDVSVPSTDPGRGAVVSVRLRAPEATGEHRSTWKMRNAEGDLFGEILFALITVA